MEFPAEGTEPELAERLAAVAEATAHCFAQQMLAAEEWAHPTTQRRVLAELMVEPAEGGADG